MTGSLETVYGRGSVRTTVEYDGLTDRQTHKAKFKNATCTDPRDILFNCNIDFKQLQNNEVGLFSIDLLTTHYNFHLNVQKSHCAENLFFII